MKVPGGGPEALTYLVYQSTTRGKHSVLPYLCVHESPREEELEREEGGVMGRVTCWKFSSIGTVLSGSPLARPVFVVLAGGHIRQKKKKMDSESQPKRRKLVNFYLICLLT